MIINEINKSDIENLNYSYYCAEQELLDNTEIVQEGFKDDMVNFINKIIARIQPIWDKFKNGGKITDEQLAQVNNYKQYYALNDTIDIPPNFDIPNIDSFNNLIGKAIPKFEDTPEFKESVTNIDTFLKSKMPDYFSAADNAGKANSIINTLSPKVFIKSSDNINTPTQISSTVKNGNIPSIQEYVQFLNNYNDTFNKLQADMKVFNDSTNIIKSAAEAIEKILSTVTTKKESALYEAENTTPNTPTAQSNVNVQSATVNTGDQNVTKPTFKSMNQSNTDGTPNTTGENNKDQSKELVKATNNYCKLCTQILSAKMQLANKVKNNALRSVLEYGKIEVQKHPEVAQKQQTNTNQQQPQQNNQQPTNVEMNQIK